MSTTIGVISDTHGSLDERAKAVFSKYKVDKILHAGDIYNAWVVRELEEIATVIAVRGNNDQSTQKFPLGEWEVIPIEGNNIYLIHNKAKAELNPTIDVAIYGHTHMPSIEREALFNILTVNPGSASKPRGGTPPSVAILTLNGPGDINAEIIDLNDSL